MWPQTLTHRQITSALSGPHRQRKPSLKQARNVSAKQWALNSCHITCILLPFCQSRNMALDCLNQPECSSILCYCCCIQHTLCAT
eukprot:13173686-Ditylum_brightwellii.AAC.1